MKFPPDQKQLLYAELAKLTGAGFSVVEAADALLDQSLPAAQRQYMRGIKAGVQERGETISEAIDRIPDVPISLLERSIIDASEKGGKLQQGFDHLSDYFQMIQKARRRIRSGLVYPVVLLHFAVLIPAIKDLILSPDKQAVITRTLLILGGIYVVVAIGFFVFKKIAKAAATSASADSLLKKIPLVGKVRHSLAMSRFCKVHQIHLLSGQRMDTALKASAEASQSGRILESVTKKVLPAVRDGDHAGAHLNQRIFQPAFARSYITAEETGSLDTDMARWAALSQEDATHRMDQLATAAPKVVYGLVVIFVIWQIFQMANGYFSAITDVLNS